MPEKIIDLDAVVGDPKKVKLRGKTYTLPPDMPVELYLRLTQLQGEEDPDTDQIRAMHDEVLKLFRDSFYGDPKLTALPEGLGIKSLMRLIIDVYGEQVDEEEPKAAPPRKPSPGKRTSRPKR